MTAAVFTSTKEADRAEGAIDALGQQEPTADASGGAPPLPVSGR
jgi:hypothetical protein